MPLNNCRMIALYMRISAQDDKEGESESIFNQRKLLYEFIKSKSEFKNCRIVEFTDDGYTGTSTRRPGLKKLTECIKRKEIDCVVVKDFSRLSRNYIDLGSFIEYFFPVYKTRFISVNDCYDSLNNENRNLDIPFKGIMNDFYSRDLSDKIKTAKREMIKSGELKISRTFYGYKKNGRENNYVIDEKTGNVVKDIFNMAQNGLTPGKIADLLNKKQIPTPYENIYGVNKKAKRFWNTTKIRDILKDERYTGTLILGRYENKNIKMPEKTSEEKWHKFYRRFEPLINERLFFDVQKKLNKAVNDSKRKDFHPFYGKVFCGNCGKTLYHAGTGQKQYFYCKYVRIDNESKCFKETLKYCALERTVLKAIIINACFFGLDRYFKENNSLNINKETENYSLNTKNTVKQKAEFYKMFKNGEITAENFYEKMQSIEDNNLTEKIKNDKTEISNKTELNNTVLKQCIKAFIDKITVYSQYEIEIAFCFSNPFKHHQQYYTYFISKKI